jgi:hypothetical protein
MTTALLLVDAQRNMLEGDDAVPSAFEMKKVLSRILAEARVAGALIVHVQNDGPPGSVDEPDTGGWQLVFVPEDGEVVVRKDESDTFLANPELAETLRSRGVESSASRQRVEVRSARGSPWCSRGVPTRPTTTRRAQRRCQPRLKGHSRLWA